MTSAMSPLIVALVIASSLPSTTASMAASRQGMELHAQMQTQMETQMKTQMQMDMQMLTTKSANPIRPVIRLLEDLLRKNREQEEEENALEKKRACECAADLKKQKAIVDHYSQGLPELEDEYKNLHAQVHMLKLDTRLAEKQLGELKDELKKLEEMYANQIAAKEQQLKDYVYNIVAMKKAIDALRKGLGAEGSAASVEGAFLQTETASYLRNLIGDADKISDQDRDTLGAFLDVDRSDAERPGTEEIIGILRQMVDTMQKDHDELEKNFNADYAEYMSLKRAKEQEIAEKEAQITSMNLKMAELMKRLVEVENLIKEILTGAFFREKELYEAMLKACALGKQIHETRRKLRAEEAEAITQAIKLLGNDEALELFKKTLPGSDQAAPVDINFMQVKATTKADRALAALMEGKHHDPRVDFIAFLLMGKKIDMTKVTTMIDELVGVLGKYQKDDLKKKEECEENLGDAKLERMRLFKELGPIGPLLDDLKAQLKEVQDGIDGLTAELNQAQAEMDELTEQRSAARTLYLKEAALDSAAYDLLRVAKQRLTNFYGGYLQVSQTTDMAPGDSTKNPATQNGQAVMELLGKIASEHKKTMTANELIEKQEQEAYEVQMDKIRAARDEKLKLMEKYRDERAELNLRIQIHEDENREAVNALMQHDLYIQSLHKDCDWLLNNYDARKEARDGEIESLKKAKMVLNGADASELTLIQEKTSHRPVRTLLRGSTSA